MKTEPGETVFDYPVHESVDVTTVTELAEVLTEHARRGDPARLIGSGSAQDRLPAPTRGPVTLIRLAGMTGIERLEPADLTCSVRPGTPRAELEAALAEHGVCLPCGQGDGTQGTLGGLFAADLQAPSAPGALGPRSLLLGFEGVLAEGQTFKSGARVVKSVAGFDLQKLFVGSRGRLFAATLLHLKLRPKPRATAAFAVARDDAETACSLFDALRLGPTPPQELWLTRESTGAFTVHGVLAGHPQHLAELKEAHDLPDVDQTDTREPCTSGESVQGMTRPGLLRTLFDRLPPHAHVVAGGTGQFTLSNLDAAQTDAVLETCAAHGTPAEVRTGAAARRGLATPLDAGVARLTADLAKALDPKDVLQ